jgi:hypothetical protein
VSLFLPDLPRVSPDQRALENHVEEKMKTGPFASLKGASRLAVIGTLCAGCTINPLQEQAGPLGKGAGDETVDSLPPPGISMPPIEPWIPENK